jgi:hypothetical protein
VLTAGNGSEDLITLRYVTYGVPAHAPEGHEARRPCQAAPGGRCAGFVGGAWGGLAAVVSWVNEGHAAGLWGQTDLTGRCPRPDTDGSQGVDL